MQITLKAARVNAGLTQAKAAELLGISEKTLWLIENKQNMPTIDLVHKFEEVYQMPYDNLLFN